ncbi:MAG TPA: FAD-dependent oxidoreductase [Chloroflexota bacterium]|nr:FAD-dependent oxidoreductase [Chloroflexota bacterium]
MARISILAVDDDRSVLNSVERDLRQKYGRDYRILKAESGAEALDLLHRIKEREETIALFVVDQRMPHMSGVEFLEQAVPLFPDARKVLLTAYADTEAAINAINKVSLDYYLLKPWHPPQDHLYPVLDGLLDEWRSNVELPYEGIRVVGAMWSSASHDIKDFLARNSVPYRWHDVDRDSEALRLLESTTKNHPDVPVLYFPDGSVLVQPSPQQVAEKIGLRTRAEFPLYDVIVVGGGPAGLSASVYASADGLKVLLVERQAPGGQAGNSPKIENFLGFPSGISGSDLTRRAVTQARRFGTEILTTQAVTGIRSEANTKIVTLSDGSEVSAKIVLIATGAWFRTLNLPGVERWNGAGIYYGAAHTEAANCADQDVVVVGGANAAAQGILYLNKYTRRVSVLIRGSSPTWSRYLDVAIRESDQTDLLFDTELIEVVGEQKIDGVTVKNRRSGEVASVPASALFVFIGQKPQSDFLGDLVKRTESGHILTGLDLMKDGKRPPDWPLNRDPLMLETSVPGIFAAGDVRNGTKHGVAAATGDGNAAVSMFWQYLATV